MTTVKVAALMASAAFVAATPSESQTPVLSPRVIEVDGTPVRILTLGLDDRASGEPAVVLQAGGGASLDTWDGLLVRTISTLAPVVAYDRPGLGGSQFDGHDPTPQHIADHLTALLDVVDVGPPYILVGHSWGGPLILYFAGQHPEDIAGLVYLDPSVPTVDRLPTDPAERTAALAQLDSLRARTLSWPEGQGAGRRANYDYWMTPPDQRAIPPNLNVPTAVVLGTQRNSGVPASVRARRVEETRTWLQDVDALHFVVAPNVGHFVHRDAPDLVTEAIRQVLDWAQERP